MEISKWPWLWFLAVAAGCASAQAPFSHSNSPIGSKSAHLGFTRLVRALETAQRLNALNTFTYWRSIMYSIPDPSERLCSASLIFGCGLAIVAHIIHPHELNSPHQVHSYLQHSPNAHLLLMFGVLLFLMGLPTLYARLNREGSFVAAASLPLLFIGIALGDMIHCPIEFGAIPAVYQVVPDRLMEIYDNLNATPYGVLSMLAGPLVMLGVLLFLIGTWRCKAMPNWPRWILIGSLAAMVGTLSGLRQLGELFPILLYAAFLAYGALMLRSLETSNAMRRSNCEDSLNTSVGSSG